MKERYCVNAIISFRSSNIICPLVPVFYVELLLFLCSKFNIVSKCMLFMFIVLSQSEVHLGLKFIIKLLITSEDLLRKVDLLDRKDNLPKEMCNCCVPKSSI